MKNWTLSGIIASLWRKGDRPPKISYLGGRKVQTAESRVFGVSRSGQPPVRATETTTHPKPNRSREESEKRQSSPLQPTNGALEVAFPSPKV